MKSTVIALALMAAVAMGKKSREDLEAESDFAQFTAKYNKHYKDRDAYEAKLKNWRMNDIFIKWNNKQADLEEKRNPGSKPARFTHNEFSDESLEQLAENGLIEDLILPDNLEEEAQEHNDGVRRLL